MNKILMTLALASCLTATHHTYSAAEAVALADQQSLDAQLLTTLKDCIDISTDVSKLMDKVENLLAQKANPNVVDEMGNTALHYAVRPYYYNKINTDAIWYFTDELETNFCHRNIENLILAGAHPDNQNGTGTTAEQYLDNMLHASAYDDRICITKTKHTLRVLQKAIAEKKARDAKAQLTPAAE